MLVRGYSRIPKTCRNNPFNTTKFAQTICETFLEYVKNFKKIMINIGKQQYTPKLNYSFGF